MEIFDYLSPHIQLQYYGKSSHSTKFGAFLTILISIMSLGCLCYFSYDLFDKNHPKAYSLNKNVDDAGKYILEPNGLFHIIGMINPVDSSHNQYDERAVRIRGRNNYGEDWDYNKCIYGIDLKGIESYSSKEEIENFMCVRKYNNKSNKITQIKNSLDANFTYPYIQYGMGSSLKSFPVYYNVFIEECTNTTENNNHCYSRETIKEVLNNNVYEIKFIDQYFDISNYKNPLVTFHNRINGKFALEQIVENSLNFSPMYLKTNDGFLFDNIYETKSFKFENFDRIITSKNPESIGFVRFGFYLQNMALTYDRVYIRVQDVLANVGGVIKALFILGNLVNYLFNHFQILLHTQKFVHSNINLYIDPSKDSSFFKKYEILNFPLNNKSNSNLNLIKPFSNQPNLVNSQSINLNDVSKFKNLKKKKTFNTNNLEIIKKFSIAREINFYDYIKKFFCFERNYRIEQLSDLRNNFLNEINIFKLHVNYLQIKKIMVKKNLVIENEELNLDELLNLYK